MDKEEIRLYRNWWAHDGMWYQSVAREFGFEAANLLNQRCLRQMAERIMHNVIRSERVDLSELNLETVARLYLKATAEMWPDDWVTTELNCVGDQVLEVAIHKNFALMLLYQIGTAERYECPCLEIRNGWFQALGLRFRQEKRACKLANSQACRFWAEFNFPDKAKNNGEEASL